MQKRLIALSVLASALLAAVPAQAHTSKTHGKPLHTKHAQAKQAHHAHGKHTKLAAAGHGSKRHHHVAHLAATTRIRDFDATAAIDADELKPSTALTLSAPDVSYLSAGTPRSTLGVDMPVWLGHAPVFNPTQMMVQADKPTFYGNLAYTDDSAASSHPANVDHSDMPAAIGGGDTGAVRQALISLAMQLRDIRYVRGGHDPATGFDCSGFVRYVFAHAIGMQLPTNSASQFLAGLRVKRSDMKPGDLVFFHTHGKRRISHVGIYISDGRFIHSPTSGKSVQISSLDEAYWAKHFAGAKRPQAIAMAARG